FVYHLCFCINQMGCASPLRPYLNLSVVLPRGIEYRLAFKHINADRFLQIQVCAGRDGVNSLTRMPVIRRTNEDKIQFMICQHFPVISVQSWHPLGDLSFADELPRFFQVIFVYVTHCNNIYIADLEEPEEVTLAVPSGADQPDPHHGLRVSKRKSRGVQCG